MVLIKKVSKMRMERFILILLLLFLPEAALADGMVVPATATPAKVTIPDQRALICYSNGTERLVIETRFTGTGTNFAWVVPLPSQPVVEAATTGLFPTLQYLFRPEIVTDVPQFFPWIIGLVWIGYAFLFVRPTGRVSRLDIVSCLMVAICIAFVQGTHGIPKGAWIALGVFVFICLFLILVLLRHWRANMHGLAVALLALFIVLQLFVPFASITSPYWVESLLDQPLFWFFLTLDLILIMSLAIWKGSGRYVCAALLVSLIFLVVFPAIAPAGKTRSASMDGQPAPMEAVSVLQRNVVGIFDTTTIASRDATALQKWLAENGYSVPANADPVIADYVKADWVFVAAKIHQDGAGLKTLTPHPLSFTFKTDSPVYPMRLTGLANKRLSVDLYVFSNMRASAPHFRIERCTQTDVSHPLLVPDDGNPLLEPAIGHPLLAEWTAGLPVATKLSGTLTADDMRQDVWLGQSSFVPKQPDRLYSRQAAWIISLNCGAAFFAVGLAVICLVGFLATEGRADLPASMGARQRVPALVSAVIIASVFVIGLSWFSLPGVDIKWIRGGRSLMRQQVFALLAGMQEENYRTLAGARADAQEICHSPDYMTSWDNVFTGGPVHEEDSPGNYLLQETNGHLQLTVYDAYGRPDAADLGPLRPAFNSSKN